MDSDGLFDERFGQACGDGVRGGAGRGALTPSAWILAGGLGTRLASAIAGRPKVLAPIGDQPFLSIVLEMLARIGFQRALLLLGHRHDDVIAYLAGRPAQASGRAMTIGCSVETAPLGTAGALKHAQPQCDGTFFLFNGDTYFAVDPAALLRVHRAAKAVVTIAVTRVEDASRYACIEAAGDGIVRSFREKDGVAAPGLINGGVYVIEPALLDEFPSGNALSLEREVIPGLLESGARVAAVPQEGPFFDIGTPADYDRFQTYWSGAGHARAPGSASRSVAP